MAINAMLQLADGEGLMSVVVFSGLSHPMIMHPAVYGEPALTAQAFCYLQELGVVAQLRFEDRKNEPSDEELEYLVDNYLFEYSKRHPTSRISFKVSSGKLWNDDPSEYYVDIDQGHTQSLALDASNDPRVSYIRAVDSSDRIDLTNWNIGVNYFMDRFEPYVRDLSTVLGKRVNTFVSPSDDRDGYVGRLRVLKPGHGLIDYWQATGLANIRLRSIPAEATTVPLVHSSCAETLDSLPIKRIVAPSFTPRRPAMAVQAQASSRIPHHHKHCNTSCQYCAG